MRIAPSDERRTSLRPGIEALKVLLQRVSSASVTVEGERVAQIGSGLLLLVGVEVGDDAGTTDASADQVLALRVFPDDAGKMNLDVRDAKGSVLVVSQFTLAASLRKGRRPSFDTAARPELARGLVERFAQRIADAGLAVGRGVFGAHMEVALTNDGPVTFMAGIAPVG